MKISKLPEIPEEIAKKTGGKSSEAASTEYSKFRTRMSEHRTGLSEHRTSLSEHRTGLSDVRSHMANERTHLAQMRTAVSLMSFGITLNRFSIYLQENDRMPVRPRGMLVLQDTAGIGLGMVLLGIALLVWSLWRYRQVFFEIETVSFTPPRFGITLLTSAVIMLGAISAVILIAT